MIRVEPMETQSCHEPWEIAGSFAAGAVATGWLFSDQADQQLTSRTATKNGGENARGTTWCQCTTKRRRRQGADSTDLVSALAPPPEFAIQSGSASLMAACKAPQRQRRSAAMHCLRRRRCLSHEGSGDARRRQRLGHEGS